MSAVISLVKGRAVVLPGDDVDTDRIVPARFLKAITFDGIEAHLFADDRAASRDAGAAHPLDRHDARDASILVVGSNFGCGSSREHAPQALRRHGFHAVVGESFSEIFSTNATAIGLVCASLARDDAARVRAVVSGLAELVVDVAALVLTAPGLVVPISMGASAREALLSGAWDATGTLREAGPLLAATAARLPYLTDFR
jgi:3-isopropylmalate/(R)-2-methylmalate dehydratase small subunit